MTRIRQMTTRIPYLGRSLVYGSRVPERPGNHRGPMSVMSIGGIDQAGVKIA